ncbi:glutaredoxin-like protein NrdH [Ochrobactrum tritici]|uniref:Glutaredoxin-like protein NrdH n=1 Tax=Brucella tritici TaxID=94626 RepID=A0A7X6FUJ1_9HYPH|nr:glutaredoxin-like protein NrdH [Brucella tritici]
MSSVILYTKPACPQCSATKRALEKLGVEYSLIDVTKDDDAYALVAGLGYRQAPVVVAGEMHWSGFRPDMISSLAA